MSWTDEAAGVVVSTSLAALGILFADRLFRPDWDFSWADHWMGAPVLYLAPAAVFGLLWTGTRMVRERLSHRFRFNPRKRDWARALMVGCLASAASVPTAIRTFSGAKVSQTWLGVAGPPLFLLGVFMGVSAVTLLLWRNQRRVAWGKHRTALSLGFAFFLAGCGAVWVDMHVYVGLYSHLHAVLEFTALGLFVCAFQLLGFVLVRRWPSMLWFNRGLGMTLLMLGLTYVAYRPLRTWTDARLAHAWVDEYYVGRALRRTQLMELQLTGGPSLRVARVQHLARRFKLTDKKLDSAYLAPTEVGPSSDIKNVVFFYVDTLRADVAADPDLMPELSRFRKEALDFRRAYATGSDTLRSLPTITRGNYFIDKNHDGDLLRLAKAFGAHRRLIVAESAHDFLGKLLPTFEFDQVDTVIDHDPDKEVWGYGADRSTATGVGDATIAFLNSEQAKRPFLLWAFHFDAHAWRELDEPYIAETRTRLGVARDGDLNVRYRVITRSMDEQFGRLLRALDESGHTNDTAVVFISDHGEGLGQGGFWVHSIFLWESLIQVPLVVRIPGVEAAAVSEPVSLVDVAPTLAGTFGGTRAVYHGDDLRGLANGERRRLPILFRAGKFQGHDRAGVLDARLKRKLVVRLEAAFPELHAYETDRLDRDNLAKNESETVRSLLRTLAVSPVFPRGENDFVLHSKPEELAAHLH